MSNYNELLLCISATIVTYEELQQITYIFNMFMNRQETVAIVILGNS